MRLADGLQEITIYKPQAENEPLIVFKAIQSFADLYFRFQVLHRQVLKKKRFLLIMLLGKSSWNISRGHSLCQTPNTTIRNQHGTLWQIISGYGKLTKTCHLQKLPISCETIAKRWSIPYHSLLQNFRGLPIPPPPPPDNPQPIYQRIAFANRLPLYLTKGQSFYNTSEEKKNPN